MNRTEYLHEMKAIAQLHSFSNKIESEGCNKMAIVVRRKSVERSIKLLETCLRFIPSEF